MAALPKPASATAQAIFRHYEEVAERGGRPHLGASLIGHECERYLWLTFRWARMPQFEGRVLRLFETGKREEDRIVANLRAIGCEVSTGPEEGAQWTFSQLAGHFGGSMDAACVGLPEAPKTWHVCEFKTANDRSFADLAKHGVRTSKYQHYVQMQMYMGWTGMQRALYVCVNKNTDELHVERVEFDEDTFNGMSQRAERVITAPEPPIPVSQSADALPCKWCDFREQCHGTEAPAVNCRTCAHSTPEMDGDARWSCAISGRDIDIGTQRVGCSEHRHIPVLLGRFAELLDATSNNLLTYRNTLTGNEFQVPVYSSHDIVNMHDKTLLGDAGLTNLKTEFDCNVVKSSTSPDVNDPFTDCKDDLPWEEAQPANPEPAKKTRARRTK